MYFLLFHWMRVVLEQIAKTLWSVSLRKNANDSNDPHIFQLIVCVSLFYSRFYYFVMYERQLRFGKYDYKRIFCGHMSTFKTRTKFR